jgi:hypothetical protein
MAEDDSFVESVFNTEMERSFPGESYKGRKVNGYEAEAYNAFKILNATLLMSEEMTEEAFLSTIKLNYRTLSILCHSDKTVNYPPAEKESAIIKYRDITTAKVRRHVDDIQRFYPFPFTF